MKQLTLFFYTKKGNDYLTYTPSKAKAKKIAASGIAVTEVTNKIIHQ